MPFVNFTEPAGTAIAGTLAQPFYCAVNGVPRPMRLFTCPNCSSRLFFDNTSCVNCGHLVCFNSRTLSFVSLGAELDGRIACSNRTSISCNWITEGPAESLCLSCGRNRLIPPIDDQIQMRRWQDAEHSKRRLIYDLLRLSLAPRPIDSPDHGLWFEIVASAEFGGAGKVTMGHDDGLITIDASEADSDVRELRRKQLGEPYRTMLGHMRHESGHYFWDRLAVMDGFLDAFRARFGDEQEDYMQALQNHYANGAPPDWQDAHISAYATAHPWEDWAETFAHFLHMMDGLETARSASLLNIQLPDQYSSDADFIQAITAWIDIAMFLNAMNRGLGYREFYPFVLNPPVRDKLAFVHDWLGRLAATM